MIFSPDQGDDVSLYTPREVIEFREKRATGKEFDDRRPMSPEVSAKMTSIHKVHGFQLESSICYLLQKVDFDLLFAYNFRDGYRFKFGDSVFPEWIKKPETKKKIVAFAPLLSLTPEEVTLEREQIALRLAASALQVINRGLIAGKVFFTLEELALSEDDSRLFTACLTRLRQLMPRYKIEHSLSRFFLTPTTSP